MMIHRALGSASLLVLCSALILAPSNTSAQTALPPVTVEAPRAIAAKPAVRRPGTRSSARTQARPTVIVATPAVSPAGGVTPAEARASLYQAPNGQIQTTVDRSRI